MFWHFGSVQAHSHSHAAEIDELFLSKAAFQEWSTEIHSLFTFLQRRIAKLPDPIPLSVLPEKARHLVSEISHPQAAHGHGLHYILLEKLFCLGPLGNAVVASVIVSWLTNLLLQFSPELSGSGLDFLVAFAEGSILGNVFLHLLPESYGSGNGWGVIYGFLTFCALDKVLKIVAKSVGHVHSHTHAAPAAPAAPAVPEPEKVEAAKTAKTSARESKLRSRKKEKHEHGHERHTHDSHDSPTQGTRSYAFLNVAADFAHNITDGVALAAAFRQSRSDGIMAFVLMILHEVPHQFGDFALLVQGGASKTTGLQAQLVASCGTLLGCFLFGAVSSQGSLQWVLEAVTPFTAGVFLYIATVGVLPEILEVSAGGVGTDLRQSLLQAAGVLVGLVVLGYFS